MLYELHCNEIFKIDFFFIFNLYNKNAIDENKIGRNYLQTKKHFCPEFKLRD